VIVTDLHGDCPHAAAFGELEQTVEKAWTLIDASLDANQRVDLRPIDARRVRGQDGNSPEGYRGQRDRQDRVVKDPPLTVPERVARSGLAGARGREHPWEPRSTPVGHR
jgi:hypothetical protein